MRKFLIYWLAPLSVIGLGAATLANPCYQNVFGGPKPACRWIGGGGWLPGGPCPWGPNIIPPFPASCGGYTINVATPTGSIGGQPTGKMSQANVQYTCKNTYICTKALVPGGAILFPVWAVACVPGGPIPAAQAWVMAATGNDCPQPPGGGGGGGGGTTVPVSGEIE
jgi:hypothetical protein